MWLSMELAELFRRDLTRLIQELSAFPDQSTLWIRVEGVTNSAGNLALHLEGNLCEYIGRQLGNAPYVRQRDQEFTTSGRSIEELISRMEDVRELVVRVVSDLGVTELDAVYPENVLGDPLSTRQFLIHLLTHLNYHLGQVDYLRRVTTQGAAIAFARL